MYTLCEIRFGNRLTFWGQGLETGEYFGGQGLDTGEHFWGPGLETGLTFWVTTSTRNDPKNHFFQIK